VEESEDAGRCWDNSATFLPHGGLTSFTQKSTCLHAINFKASYGVNLVTLLPKLGGGGSERGFDALLGPLGNLGNRQDTGSD